MCQDVIRMIRVTKTEEQSRTLITIDGDLSGESVEAVDTCCSQADPNQKPVYLFLRDVTTVDQSGITLLGRLARKGVHLLARGVYTSYLIEAVGTGDAVERLSSADTEHLASTARRTR
jgi:ABC-type transporter Mla MlaB component